MKRQFTMPIEFPPMCGVPSRTNWRWKAAVAVLRKQLAVAGIKPPAMVHLAIPIVGVVGWYVRRGGVSFRCLYQWAMMGTTDDPTPRFLGRVDVAFTDEDSGSTRASADASSTSARTPRADAG